MTDATKKTNAIGLRDRITAIPPIREAAYPVFRDGALHTPGRVSSGLGFADGVTELARQFVRNESLDAPSSLADRISRHIEVTAYSDQAQIQTVLKQIDTRRLSLHATKAQIWLTPISMDRVNAQWHVPVTVMRNCRTLLGNGSDQIAFVVRGYARHAAEHSQAHYVKLFEIELDSTTAQKTLRGAAIPRLDTIELGVRCPQGRYVFLARNVVSPPQVNRGVASASKPHASRLHIPMPDRYRIVPSAATLDATEVDWQTRDLHAEAYVQALYTRFLEEGTRVLRREPAAQRASLEIRDLEYEARQIRRAQSFSLTTPSKTFNGSKVAMKWARLDSFRAPVATKEPATNEKLVYPPACYTPAVKAMPLSAISALPSCMAIPRETLPLFGHTTELGSAASPRVIKFRKSGDLKKAIREAEIAGRSEIVLRGKVRPGQRVRVGGLLIEPARDGSFCVACVIRNGQLHVPVEEVEAVVLSC